MVLRDSFNFEYLLHAKWSKFAKAHKKSTKVSGMLREDEKLIRQKFR